MSKESTRGQRVSTQKRSFRPPAASPVRQPAANASRRRSKSDNVLALLQRRKGATVSELVAATDWQPHTVRAALTRLRQKGKAIHRDKRGEQTCYHLAMEKPS